MHVEQISAYSEEKGVAHILHYGPACSSILCQQLLQKGAVKSLSLGQPHTGQSEGKMWFMIFDINPE